MVDIGRSILFSSIVAFVVSNQPANTDSTLAKARGWATKFRAELMSVEEYVTRYSQVNESFKEADLVKRDDESLTAEITKEIKEMMELKISAVRRIMDAAENTAMSSQDDVVEEFEYFNAKCLASNEDPCTNDTMKANLLANPHFWDLNVNTSFSAVHVPTNVYDKAQDVLKAIKWSENLDDIFKNNFHQDPSLSWQYFGSSTGFMRQYPAIQWKQEPVDLYDCRTRSWFIEAATGPKDMVILVDQSGSMTGIRKEIARHVVNNILDTLGNNDYVNIFKFGEETTEIVECFRDKLVQANLANIRTFKHHMENIKTVNIANFSFSLHKAFSLLENYRNNTDEYAGAKCNQAIMLITDGVPYNFIEIFQEYNWPSKPVRVFTYLVGREVADVREIKWMACANRGYYVHLSTLAEVREQVLQYIPVMARPLVLNKVNHPIIWSPVYADVTDPKMTDWLWEEKEKQEQKRMFIEYRKKIKLSPEEQKKRIEETKRRTSDQRGNIQEYKLMTSVSMPVFDRRENASRVANLLGVAGTDVPISEIQKLMNPFKLGVNAYTFIVTNNGYVLIHPDLRPVFQGILKPNYNSVDMAELELTSTEGRRPREFSYNLLMLREAIINQERVGNATLMTKYHYDDMRRVGFMKRRYYFMPIENSIFTVVVSVPADKHRQYQVKDVLEVHADAITERKLMSEYLRGKRWRVHPDWTYCKYLNDTYYSFTSPEEELVHFLKRVQSPGWKWKTKTVVAIPPETHHQRSQTQNQQHSSSWEKPNKSDKDLYFCDRDLVLNFAFDAMVTKWFDEDIRSPNTTKKFEVTVAFLATRSGLTRWQDLGNERGEDEPSFGDLHNKAIDEIWYKRAVELNYADHASFVYSVPFDAGGSNGTLVTASHAIFRSDGNGNRAPAAVVGYQFQHSALSHWFFTVTSECLTADCGRTCASDDLDCFVLDNNGFIVVSENTKNTGVFFGEVHGKVMESMVAENIFRKVRIFDYQAVCFPRTEAESRGHFVMTPMKLMYWLWRWFLGRLIWMMAEFGLGLSNAIDIDTQANYQEEEEEQRPLPETSDGSEAARPHVANENAYILNRTRPQSCDQEVDLYMLLPRNENYSREVNDSTRPFVVQPIESTNLILVVVDTLYRTELLPITLQPTEVLYGNDSLTCYKVDSNDLPRKRPRDCLSRHEKEEQIELCGRGCQQSSSWLSLFAAIVAAFRTTKLLL